MEPASPILYRISQQHRLGEIRDPLEIYEAHFRAAMPNRIPYVEKYDGNDVALQKRPETGVCVEMYRGALPDLATGYWWTPIPEYACHYTWKGLYYNKGVPSDYLKSNFYAATVDISRIYKTASSSAEFFIFDIKPEEVQSREFPPKDKMLFLTAMVSGRKEVKLSYYEWVFSKYAEKLLELRKAITALDK